jgi:hypothetical protein
MTDSMLAKWRESLPTYLISFRQRNWYLPNDLWYTDDDDNDGNFKSFIYIYMK